MSKLVLTIDDTPEIRQLIRMTLEFEDFDVIEASSGQEGLEVAKLRKPDLVVLDVMMPGALDGLAVSKAMGEDPELCSIPVIMVSALELAHQVSAGYAAGARAYLGKPFSPTELIDLVHALTTHD
ncbi:MAG: response regulator [Curvibacter sp.]|nr:response regulator [Curvibacter sp.]